MAISMPDELFSRGVAERRQSLRSVPGIGCLNAPGPWNGPVDNPAHFGEACLLCDPTRKGMWRKSRNSSQFGHGDPKRSRESAGRDTMFVGNFTQKGRRAHEFSRTPAISGLQREPRDDSWGKDMAKSVESRGRPVSIRMTDHDFALIDRAASLRNCSRADFVREAAVRAAEDALMEQRLIRMSNRGFGAFVAELARPAQAVPQLVEILKRPAPWDKR
ncbi:type II toxin-antitoxin system TacA family antitoxin [Novosphingobium indicum]|uniref:type II toxin-antitoxin system TacA family antitoxin n=1 Tax=Novosphingobium indicum TaxID=462949 RepID=UPI0027E503C7|nr:DUF1778 domain-containing protein [Novosphingobium indicum]